MADDTYIGAAGSQNWATTTNWSTGAIPVSADNAWLLEAVASLIDQTAGLDQHLVTLANLYIGSAFMGAGGTVGNGTLASGDYLQIGATNWIAGYGGSQSGFTASSRVKLDFGSTAFTGVVRSTPNSLDNGLETLRIKGSNAGNTLYVLGGIVGVATTRPGETATIATTDIADGTLNFGPGVTWTTINQSGGTLTLRSGGTTLIQTGAPGGSTPVLNTFGTAAITNLTVAGTALINHRPAAGTDAIATLTIDTDGVADFTNDPRSVTITNPVKMYKGSTLKAFSPGQLALHAAPLRVQLVQCTIDDVTIQLGRGVLLDIQSG